MIWFTADTHFFHKKLLDEDKGRSQFRSVMEMNEMIILHWNRVVGQEDIVYHIGDLSFGKAEETAETVNRLLGTKILVRGNHDKRTETAYKKMGFYGVCDEAGLNIQGHVFRMAHLPYRAGQIERHAAKYGEFYTEREEGDRTKLLCGHVHGAYRRFGADILNVGVDVWDYTPVSADQVLAEFNLKPNL